MWLVDFFVSLFSLILFLDGLAWYGLGNAWVTKQKVYQHYPPTFAQPSLIIVLNFVLISLLPEFYTLLELWLGRLGNLLGI